MGMPQRLSEWDIQVVNVRENKAFYAYPMRVCLRSTIFRIVFRLVFKHVPDADVVL